MTDHGAVHELESDVSALAVAIFSPDTVMATLGRIVDLAVQAVDGCDAAGVFFVVDGIVTTVADTDPIVVELDALQVQALEGPCLDALARAGSFYAADLADDPRWPVFGPLATAAGIRSLIAFHLSSQPVSALNLYAHLPGAFGATDRAKGQIFATLAGLALSTALVRRDGEDRATNLKEALRTRELIGQAQGILMERERITAEQAFSVLRRASQHLNIKVREVATQLVETGESPAQRPSP